MFSGCLFRALCFFFHFYRRLVTFLRNFPLKGSMQVSGHTVLEKKHFTEPQKAPKTTCFSRKSSDTGKKKLKIHPIQTKVSIFAI